MSNTLVKVIESQIANTKKRRNENQLSAYDFGMELLFKTKEDLDQLRISLGNNHPDFKQVSDLLSKEILQCGIDYFKAMKDNSSFSQSNSLEILESAKYLTTNHQILGRINDNIEGIKDWVKAQSHIDGQNKIYDFNRILLKTAFSFMTCDGHIDQNEVALIKKMAEQEVLFGDIDIEKELDAFITGINTLGIGYLKEYITIIRKGNLTHEEELALVEIAVKTLYADGKVDYNEIKFFRIFRTLLNVTNEQIRAKCPTLADEFFESDIFTHSYLRKLFDDYFEKIEMPIFEKIG